MSDEPNPEIQILFANAHRDLASEDFVARVMEGVSRLERISKAGRIAAVIALIAVGGLLALPLQEAILLLTDGLGTAIIAPNDNLLTQMLSPLNSVAGILALLLIGMQFAFRALRN